MEAHRQQRGHATLKPKDHTDTFLSCFSNVSPNARPSRFGRPLPYKHTAEAAHLVAIVETEGEYKSQALLFWIFFCLLIVRFDGAIGYHFGFWNWVLTMFFYVLTHTHTFLPLPPVCP